MFFFNVSSCVFLDLLLYGRPPHRPPRKPFRNCFAEATLPRFEQPSERPPRGDLYELGDISQLVCAQLFHCCISATLLRSVAVPVVGTVSAMNGWHRGLGERYRAQLWSVLQVCAAPIGNMLSLLLGDRRKPWVKLDYE